MTAQTKGKVPRDVSDSETVPPLLKTCVMCRTRKVKCGSEKPSCSNCIKYRCECIYAPSIRHLRPRPHTLVSSGGSVSKPIHKQRKQCTALEVVGSSISSNTSSSNARTTHRSTGASDTSAYARSPLPSLPLGSNPITTTTIASDGNSFSRLMKPVAPLSHMTHANMSGIVTHTQLPTTAPILPPPPPSQYSQTPPLPSSQVQSHQQIQLRHNHFTLGPIQQQQQQQQQQQRGSPRQSQHHPQLQQQQMMPMSLLGSLPHAVLPRVVSESRDSSSPIISSPKSWRAHLPLIARSNSPDMRQNQPTDNQTDPSTRGINDTIRNLSMYNTLPPGTERIERSASIAASVSSLGSLSATHSPSFANSGVDPKQIEATLPKPAPDTLDNMLKAYFRYQYPSSGIVLEEFFWFRYHRNMLTPLIIYAMLAVATWNLATDEKGEIGDKYIGVHELFYRTAKEYVEEAMDEAHLRSVQGLLVLANYEALVGRWGTMWNHTTMARRLAEGIIFRNTDFPWLDVQQEEFDFEFQRVQRAYWHSLINDIWASVLMDKQIGGVEITLPPKPTHDFTYRNIELLSSDSVPGYEVSLGATALQDPRLGNTAASGELFLLIGAVNNAAFLFQHAGKPPLFETFIDFEMRLTNWYLNLPEDVRLDDTNIARFTSTEDRADLGEIISTHIFWNFARLLLMRMGLVLSLNEDPSLLRNIYSTRAFYNTSSAALQFYQSSMPILTPDKTKTYDEWLFHFCRCMSLQSSQNVVNLLKLGEQYQVHPGHFGAGLNLPLVQVVSVSMGLVYSPDAEVVRIALDHLITVIRTLLRLKHWFNTALLLLHLFLSMQDPALLLPSNSCIDDGFAKTDSEDMATDESDDIQKFREIEASCPFPPAHLITELMRRLRMSFEDFVNETICAVRISSPTRGRVDPCISPLLRHLPEQQHIDIESAESAEPDWFKYAPSYLRSAWKRLVRTYKSTRADASAAWLE
ncbi:hypothetical protein COEREDRAFT_102323 [Coemansia reversa NRRL 1564]|uniref:Zn(2)-C6 fungal-type domain-containing protein n=1 Tax=Coemansia reversa (strain ATCC 12441 / NRRL 1564) TaxID=763665 RepID=A0A2G5BBH1_COERN|nr:hypothetical protein COEREDRAFT_102323 [Coemansia reversa NRRL 1564]|eukprot:PIA16356.1 hypothetical protein COEREDRAFT_102323 [Coemansia reversa NRRL 1564]